MTQQYDFYISVDGAALKKARIEAGLSMKQLGEHTGFSAARIGNFESEKNPATKASKGLKIAEVLGVDSELLFPGISARRAAVAEAEKPTKSKPYGFLVTIESGRITEARERCGVSVMEMCASAGITQPAYFFMETGRVKRTKNTTAENIAKALSVAPADLFPDYEEKAARYSSRPGKKLSPEEREQYAKELLPYVERLAFKYADRLPHSDPDETFSIFLITFAEALMTCRLDGGASVRTYITAAIKKKVVSEQRSSYAQKTPPSSLSLDAIAYANSGRAKLFGNTETLGDLMASSYNLEDHIEAREELRMRIRYADEDTRQLVTKAVNL